MSMDRRTLLKGLALGGLVGPLVASPLSALASTTPGIAAGTKRPTLALVGSAAGDAFVHGARAISGASLTVLRANRSLAFVRELEQRLRDTRPVRMIGLLDNADAAPLLDVMRSAGASIPWLGQHSVRPGESRHRLMTTASAGDCARQLGRQLESCGTGFAIIEERSGRPAPVFQTDARARSTDPSTDHPGQWAVSVGWLLAAMGARKDGTAPMPQSNPMPLVGSFVSFLSEPEGVMIHE